MKSSTTKMIVGMAVAAAAGAAIGMLLAPEKGADLQKKIRDGFRSFFDDVKGILSAGQELAQNAVDEVDGKANELKSELHRIEE